MSALEIAESVEAVEQRLRGHFLVELTDERGRVVAREEAGNFVSVAMRDHAKWMARYPYRGSWAAVNTDPEPLYLWYRVMLTDSTKAESSGTENMAPGKTVAWANRQAYAGNAPLRGTMNTAESVITPTQCKWVFDWPSSGGIGTFQSLCWAYDGVARSNVSPLNRASDSADQYAWWGEAGLLSYAYGNSFGNALNPYAPSSLIHEESTGTVWRLQSRGSTQLQKWTGLLTQPVTALSDTGAGLGATGTAVTGAYANDFTVANGVYDLGYPGSGGALWATQSASPYALQRYNFPAGGAVQQTVTKPWSDAEPGMVAFDGTNVYCCRNGTTLLLPSSTNGLDPSGPVTIYKVRASDGVTLGSWTHPRRVWAMNWDSTNNRLLIGDVYGYGRSDASSLTTQVGTVLRVVAYDTTGNLDWQATPVNPYAWQNSSSLPLTEVSVLGYAGDVITGLNWSSNSQTNGYSMFRSKVGNLGARALLGAALTKSSLQTMKVTYTITFS